MIVSESVACMGLANAHTNILYASHLLRCGSILIFEINPGLCSRINLASVMGTLILRLA